MGIRIAVIIFTCFIALSALAGGRGGHNTTYDPNYWPGANYTMINCTGSDGAAFDSWKSAAIAANPQRAVLHTTGVQCGGFTNSPSPQEITNGITNAVIWTYGTPWVNQVNFGASPNFGTVADPNGDLLASNASVGATSVTLATPAQASQYTVGQWAVVVGLNAEATDCGFPPGPRFYDYVLVTGTNAGTGVIQFTPALTYNYLTTWPSVCTIVPGPAAIVPMGANWGATVSVYGLNVNNVGACAQTVMRLRSVYVLDSVFSNPAVCPPGGSTGLDPTVSQSFFVGYSDLGNTEVDKVIDNLVIDHSTGTQVFVATTNIKNLTVSNTTLNNYNITINGTSLTGKWIGTSGHSSFINSKFAQLWVGPDGSGSTTLSDNSLLLDHVTVPTATVYFAFEAISSMSYNSGTGVITVPTCNSMCSWFHVAVPGQKVALGENGLIGTPVQAFTFTGVTADMSNNISIQTDLVGAFPTSNCGATCTQIVIYPAQKGGITQINNPVGTPDFTQYAAPN